MNFKSKLKKTIAIAAIGTLASVAVNCHPDKIEEDALLAALAFSTVSSLGKGNCAISVNATGLFYGNLEQAIIGSAAGTDPGFLAHYNAVNNTNLAALATEPYNKKYDTFYTDKGTWNSTSRAALLNANQNAATLATIKAARGSAILACGRIPKSSCSVSGLSTANQATDITNAINVANLLLNTPACKNTSPTVENRLLNAALRGIQDTVTLQNGAFVPSTITKGSNLSFSSTDAGGLQAAGGAAGYIHLEGNQVLGEKAYPKVGALVSLGFGALMPVREGTTAYSLSATDYTRGSNIATANVESCESIGMGSTGFVASSTTSLTPVKEVLYALSPQNTAAGIYATVVGATALTSELGAAGDKPVSGIITPTAGRTQVINDAIACNSAMRAKVAIPVAVGGGKLDEINAISGDGFNTRLLTTCVYGSTTPRGTLKAILGSADDTGINGTLNGIADCPAAAASVAAKFGDSGLTNLSNFPND